MAEKSRSEYSIINMATNLPGYFLDMLLGFCCRVIFVRTLSEDYLGVNGLFGNILSMLSLAELGVGSAITYALYKPIAEHDESKIASLMLLYKKAYAIIGVVVGIVGLGMIPFLNIIIREPPAIKENLYLIYCLYLANTVISYFFRYRGSLLSAMQRNYIVDVYNYLQAFVQSVLQIVFLLITHEFIYYLVIQILCVIGYNICLSNKAKKDYPYICAKQVAEIPKEEKKTIFRNVKALMIGKLCAILVNNTDHIAITFFNGISSVGFASNYLLFSKTLDKLVTGTFNGLVGSVGNLNALSDDDRRYSFFKSYNLACFWLYGWAAIGIMVVASDMVQLLFGAKYVMEPRVPIIIGINMYSIGMMHSVYTYKSTLGLFRYGQYIGLFTGSINIAMDVILGKYYGVFGIFLATLIARALTTLWYEPYAVFRYGIHKKPTLYFIRAFEFIVILALSYTVCELFCLLLHTNILVTVVLKIVICSVFFNGFFFLYFSRTDELQYLINSVSRILEKITRRFTRKQR